MKRAVLLSALLALAAAAPAARAQAPDIDAGAVFLVAGAKLAHTPYRGTVLVAAPWPGGHVGVVLNRPMQVSLGDLFPDDVPSQAVSDPVHFGGAYRMRAIVAVVKSAAPPGENSIPLTAGVWLALGAAEVDRAIAEHPGAARFYAGYTRWSEGALAAMIAEGSLALAPADSAKLFLADTSQLYRELAPAAPPSRGPAAPNGARLQRMELRR